MIEVKIPKDIKNYKERFALNLTIRQFISFFVTVVVTIPLFILGVFKFKWDPDLLGWLVLLIAIPTIGIGFFSYNGMTIERFILQWLKTNIFFPEKRMHKSKNKIMEMINYEPKEFENKRQENKNGNSKNSSRHNTLPRDIL